MLRRKNSAKKKIKKSIAKLFFLKLFTFHRNPKGAFFIELFPEKPNTDILQIIDYQVSKDEEINQLIKSLQL